MPTSPFAINSSPSTRRPVPLDAMTLLLVLLPIAAATVLVSLAPKIRHSTLVFAWVWACGALAVTTLVEWSVLASATSVAGGPLTLGGPSRIGDASVVAASGWGTPAWAEPARFAAFALCFCPFISVLGSKRPHEQAWQWIVLSLWAILVLPAGEWLVLRRGVILEIHGVRAWFLLTLIVVHATHALGTRAWLAGVFLAIAQLLVFGRYLPLAGSGISSWLDERFTPDVLAVVMWSLVLASLIALRISWRERPQVAPRSRVWLDFRDRFGTLWSLRVLERVQAASTSTSTSTSRAQRVGDGLSPSQASEAFCLTWSGERALGSDGTEHAAGVSPLGDQVLWNLLRRFVDRQWCQQRGWTPPASGEE